MKPFGSEILDDVTLSLDVATWKSLLKFDREDEMKRQSNDTLNSVNTAAM